MAGRTKRSATIAPAKADPRRVRGRAREDAAFPAPPPRSGLPRDYADILREIKRRIRDERLRVVMAANSAMVLLYWDIGRLILERQERAGWGARVIDRLAADLREAYPDMKGLSPRNLKYMRAFAAAWPARAIVQQVAAQIPWFHNCLLLDKAPDPPVRLWYVRQTLEQGWSRNILSLQIESRAHERQGKAVTKTFRDHAAAGRVGPRRAGLRSKNRIVVAYALRDLKKLIGVAQWETRIVKSLPKELKGSPSVEEIEKELQDVE